jgi:hypothetical protein
VQTLSQFLAFFKDTHGLVVSNWSIVNQKKRDITLYPSSELNLALLPPFTLTKNEAHSALQANRAVPSSEKFRYLAKWQELKALGEDAAMQALAVPPADPDPSIRALLSGKAGVDLTKRRFFKLDGILFEAPEGSDELETPDVVLEL